MFFTRTAQVALIVTSLVGSLLTTFPQQGAKNIPVPPTASYTLAIGTLSGPVHPLADSHHGQTAATVYLADPHQISTILAHPQYFQVQGVAQGTTYSYPWRFSRNVSTPHASVLVYAQNPTNHTQLIAVGIVQMGALQRHASGHTAGGGDLPATSGAATTPPSSLAAPASCGQCGGWTASYTVDVAYLDPVDLIVTEGKTNLSCYVNHGYLSNCHGWWWAYWLDDGWQLDSSYYSYPQQTGSDVWNQTILRFEHPWFCNGQTTYADYHPLQVTIHPTGEPVNESNTSVHGGCANWLTLYDFSGWAS